MPVTPELPTANLPAPAADLIPHRHPVRLIEHLLEVNADSGRASATVRAGSLYVNADGTLDGTAYLELMGQTFAAVKGWRDREQGHPPRAGVLAGATRVDCTGTARVGEQLTVAIQQSGTFGPFEMIEGHICRQDQHIASGQLKLWLNPLHDPSGDITNTARQKTTPPLISLKKAIRAASERPMEWEANGSIAQSFCFPPAFIAFRGHFPGNPLLPAFVQIQMAHVMLEFAGQAPLQLERIDKAKFREPLHPGQSVRVHCHWDDAPNKGPATVSLRVKDRLIATFHLTFQTFKQPPM